MNTPEGDLSNDKLRAIAAHSAVKMFEIKLSQGAKPGKGGILPGEKVTAEIAQIRGGVVGQASISPNAHPDMHNVDDLLNMIDQVRTVTAKPVGIKLAVGQLDFFTDLFRAIQVRGLVCCLLYTSPSPRDATLSRMPSSA